MVPFLNAIGTDVACVGVSMASKVDFLEIGMSLTNIRITISTLELRNFDT